MNLGEIKWVDSKAYAICEACLKMVQLNKRLLGSTHVCLSPEEREAKRRQSNG